MLAKQHDNMGPKFEEGQTAKPPNKLKPPNLQNIEGLQNNMGLKSEEGQTAKPPNKLKPPNLQNIEGLQNNMGPKSEEGQTAKPPNKLKPPNLQNIEGLQNNMGPKFPRLHFPHDEKMAGNACFATSPAPRLSRLPSGSTGRSSEPRGTRPSRRPNGPRVRTGWSSPPTS